MDERLTKKQKFIIEFVRNHEVENVTRLVKNVSKELKCSESCVWNNVNSLKRLGHGCQVEVLGDKKIVRVIRNNGKG